MSSPRSMRKCRLKPSSRAWRSAPNCRSGASPGVTEICPSNASYLVRFDPDVIHPDKMLGTLKEIEAAIGSADLELPTRIIEIPVLYNDPWTHETLMRFRERHQDPTSTDSNMAPASTATNRSTNSSPRIPAHRGSSPWSASSPASRSCSRWWSARSRLRCRSICGRAPTRRSSPVGHGGCFTAIYSVRGAGGYQLFGITPAPIYDPAQGLPYLKDFMVFFRPGDIVKWKPITREEYDRDIKAVEAGTFDLTIRPVTFLAQGLSRRSRRLQPASGGGAPWPLR